MSCEIFTTGGGGVGDGTHFTLSHSCWLRGGAGGVAVGRQWAAAVGGRILMNGGLALPTRASQHDDNFSTERERSHGDNSVFCVREMANPNEEPYFFRSLSMLSPRSLCLAIALSWSSTLHGGFWGLQSVFFSAPALWCRCSSSPWRPVNN